MPSSPAPRTWSSGPTGGIWALPRSAMTLGEGVEDDVGAGELAGAGRLVGPGDPALLVDEDEGAVGEAERRVEVGAVGAGDLSLRLEVREQGGVDPQLLLEGLVSEEAVDADPDQLDPLAGDLRLDLLVDRELVAADGAEVAWVEDQQHLATLVVGEGDLLPVLIAEGEVGGLVPDADHRRRPSSLTRAR